MSLAPRTTAVLAASLFAAFLFSPLRAADNDYQYDADYSGTAVAIQRELPGNPRTRLRKTQEAWVLMSFVVTADGRAVDPIIVNSSGGGPFEAEVRAVTERWRFQPTASGAELPLNFSETRFTIRGKGKGTTRKFARYARHIMTNLHKERPEAARGVADEAVRIGGWNLYESTILWLMLGRVEGAEGDDVEKLEMYRRGLAVSDNRSLQSNARVDLLEDIFELQEQFGQYAAALQTLETLSGVRGSKDAVSRLSPQAADLLIALENDTVVAAKAALMNPCDCEEGSPLWSYSPLRRAFSFANVEGNVERFEARCERHRISDTVSAKRKWTLDDDWGQCQVFVFGDDHATFDFLGHLPDNGEKSASDQTAVARNHVLDKRSRSQ